MTGEEMERAIQFLLDHHAKFSANIDQLKESQARTSDNLERLVGVVSNLADSVTRLEVQAESDRQEIRDAIDKLILANEVTRDLAQQAAQLAISASQRITRLEDQP